MSKRTPNEIHSERLQMHEANVAGRQKYIDPKTGSFFDSLLETRPCPSCHEDHEQFLFIKDGGRHVKCRQCEMIYLNPVFKDEDLENHYRKNHSGQSEIVANDSEFYTYLYTKGLRSIEKNAQTNNILDIGCSAGGFLDCAKEASWKTFGVELNEKEAEYATKKGHTVYNQLLEEITLSEPIHAVSLWDVFEHLKDGRAYLNMIKDLLTPEGVIFLQIPSADSLAAKMLQEKCNMFDGIEHVNLYSYKAIEQLANECDLKILSCETVISEIGVMNNYLNYDDPYLGNTTNTSSLCSVLDEESLHKQRLGYKMQIVLGKQA